MHYVQTELIFSNQELSFLPIDTGPDEPFIELVERKQNQYGSFQDIRLYEGVTQRDLINFINKYRQRQKEIVKISGHIHQNIADLKLEQSAKTK